MKAPFRPVRNFSRSNSGALWPHKYFLKGAFYLERFCTRLSRLLVSQLLLNNFYFTHNGSNDQGVLQVQSASYTFTQACCSLAIVSPIGKGSVAFYFEGASLNMAPLRVRSNTNKAPLWIVIICNGTLIKAFIAEGVVCHCEWSLVDLELVLWSKNCQ